MTSPAQPPSSVVNASTEASTGCGPAALFPAAPKLGEAVPVFHARTTQGPVSLSDYRGQWLIFFSHPADFTPVCTSEFIAIAQAADRFAARQCALLALSVDSLHSHLAWLRAIKDQFGVTIPFPIVEDPSMVIGRAYGMIDQAAADSSTVRGSFFIDPHGILRAALFYPMQVGRSVEEMLRLLIALQETSSNDILTPEGWQPGSPVLLPAPLTQAESLTGNRMDERWLCRYRKGG